MLWVAQDFFRSVRCTIPREELTSTTLSGVQPLFPKTKALRAAFQENWLF